jgi:undecaprenyl-diphosphatase
MFFLKQFFNRPRPLTPLLEPVNGLSFPSGHALMSVTFYGLLIVLVWENTAARFKKWIVTILLLLLISLIGFSRVYLRLHYFSDVIAGFAAGMIWLTLSIWTISWIERFSRRKIDPAITKNQLTLKSEKNES